MSEDSIFIVNVQHIQVIAFQMRNSPENTLILFIFVYVSLREEKIYENTVNDALIHRKLRPTVEIDCHADIDATTL